MHEHELKENAVVKGSILIVSTSCSKAAEFDTGAWLPDIALPFVAFKNGGYDVTLSSIQGGSIPLDPAGLEAAKGLADAERFLNCESAMQQLHHSVPLSSVESVTTYSAILLAGGHGALEDMRSSKHLGQLLTEAHDRGCVVAALAQGISGLLSTPELLRGKRMTPVGDAEEASRGRLGVLSFSLEQEMRKAGAILEPRGPKECHVIRDNNLLTGQNSESAEKLSQRVLETLAERCPHTIAPAASPIIPSSHTIPARGVITGL
ncbi:MAG: hypothetical protein WDW38_006231 [Sanguina aurantia]